MSWKIRHEGSPKAVENLTLDQIIEGLQDGLWEVTDEVIDSPASLVFTQAGNRMHAQKALLKWIFTVR